jgi:hypothetical protein
VRRLAIQGVEGRSLLERALDVTDSPPQASFIERMETEMLIEAGCVVTDRIHDDSAGTELVTTADAAAQRVDKEMTAKPSPVLGPIQRQSRQQYDWNRVGHATAQSRRRTLMANGAHRKRVVADHALAPAQHVAGGRPRHGGNPRGGPQPTIEFLDSGVERIDIVGRRQRPDRP